MRTSSANKPKLRIFSLLKLFVVLVLCSGIVQAQPQSSQTDSESNLLFSFKKIYLEPPRDNVDGAFRDTFIQAYKDVFDQNPRFEITSDDQKADTFVKTKIEKKATGIECEISIVLMPSQETFSNEKITLPTQASGEELTVGAKKALKTALKRIPFYGTVTGREGDELTFDIGASNGLKAGDVVSIARIDRVKKHPLLKTILDVEMIPVGTAEIDVVEQTISFGHLRSEIMGEKIQRAHKVTAVEERVAERKQPSELPDGSFDAERGLVTGVQSRRPEIGFVGLGPYIGSLSNTLSQNNGAISTNGAGFHYAADLFGELWLTKNWFSAIEFRFGGSSFALTEEVTKAKSSSFSTTTTNFNLDFGYKHYLWNSTRGPNIYGTFGYGSFSWFTPTEAAWVMGPRSYSAFRLGMGGGFPLQSRHSGFNIGLNYGAFPTFEAKETKVTPDSSQLYSASVIAFNVSFYNYIFSNMALQMKLIFETYSVEYTGGANNFGLSTTSQKQIGILPALVYYF